MGLPLVILRNKQNEIKVFHNVCSHRGMLLVHNEMEVQGALRCKYHSWSYNLDGELKGTPHFGGIGQQKVDGFIEFSERRTIGVGPNTRIDTRLRK